MLTTARMIEADIVMRIPVQADGFDKTGPAFRRFPANRTCRGHAKIDVNDPTRTSEPLGLVPKIAYAWVGASGRDQQ